MKKMLLLRYEQYKFILFHWDSIESFLHRVGTFKKGCSIFDINPQKSKWSLILKNSKITKTLSLSTGHFFLMSISGQRRQSFIPLWVKNEESFILSVNFDMYFIEYSSESLKHCRRGHINYFGISIGFIFICNPKIT
jgi:hypothetical protein